MRVLVNGLATAGRKTGIGYYTSELLRCLHQLVEPEEVQVFQPGWMGRAKHYLAGLRPSAEKPVNLRASATPPRPTWKMRVYDWVGQVGQAAYRWRFRRFARAGRYDLYHEPSFLPIDCDLPTVVTIHDLSVLLHPEWHPADRVAHHQRQFERGLTQASHVLAVSEHARQEIIRTLGLPADRVSRTYLGVRPGLAPLPPEEVTARLHQMGLPPRYLLYLGSIEPRKNVLMLLRAYCSLPVTVRLHYPLVLAGPWGWNSADVHEYLEREARHRGVFYVGYVADEQLPVLYNGARALVFPSRYEGFGLPPVEMLACGGAVLASTAGAVAETVGTRGCLLDPDDLAGWRRAMERVCTDQDWWQMLRQNAVDAAHAFTWERCARETLAVYRHLTESPATCQQRLHQAA